MKIPVIRMARLGLVFLCVFLGWLSYLDYQNSQVSVEWSTATELNTIGFNIYRGSEPDAQRLQLNDGLIPSSSDSLVGGEYSFVDTAVRPGVIYYYWLEDVDDSGTRTLHGPIDVRAQGRIAFSALLLVVCLGLLAISFLYMAQKSAGVQHA